jgi:hypothetical protein
VSLGRIVVLVLVLAHAAGLAELIERDACEEICREDGCNGNGCLPGQTHTCRCNCTGVMLLLGGTRPVISKVDTPTRVAAADGTQRAHASPDPREILHVPRRAA